MPELPLLREQLHFMLDRGETWVKDNWSKVNPRIETWWKAYKNWESADTFKQAFLDNRMTVRTFDGTFSKQVSKSFPKGELSVERFFADGQYTACGEQQQKEHSQKFKTKPEHLKYHAQRGIDSSAFANPENFVSRKKKYEEGLHDLSASLLNSKFPIFQQVHHQWVQGAHYSFLPVSWPDDQEVLYRLAQLAKSLKATLPALDELVRGYRAAMTRVKLAQDSDMAIGYTAVPIENPGDGPAYKLRYGLGNKTNSVEVTGVDQEGKLLTKRNTLTVTAQVYADRKKSALNFREILLSKYAVKGLKNEIVIAMRHHAGPFPVYAYREGEELVCYDIEGGNVKPNNKKISASGNMT
jgi:hypothetical protein